jgi:hypothetical protein
MWIRLKASAYRFVGLQDCRPTGMWAYRNVDGTLWCMDVVCTLCAPPSHGQLFSDSVTLDTTHGSPPLNGTTLL